MKRTIVIMVAVWLAAMGLMLFCGPLRARYWAWRIARAKDAAEQDHYAARLASNPDAALGVTRGLLAHGDPNVRLLAVHVIGKATEAEAVEQLLLALADQQDGVRDAAALALGTRQQGGLVQRLATLASRKGGAVGASAVFALQRNASPAAADAIIEVLSSAAGAEVRTQAIESLGLLSVERARSVLTQMLEDHRPATTMPANERAVWHALAQQRSQVGIPRAAVEALAGRSTRTVADHAAEALRRIDLVQTASRPTTRDRTRQQAETQPRR